MKERRSARQRHSCRPGRYPPIWWDSAEFPILDLRDCSFIMLFIKDKVQAYNPSDSAGIIRRLKIIDTWTYFCVFIFVKIAGWKPALRPKKSHCSRYCSGT